MTESKPDPLQKQILALQRLISEWGRRLEKLKLRKAQLGLSADVSLDIEIEDIEATLEKLNTELKELQAEEKRNEVSVSRANLMRPDLSKVNLREAPLRGAYLHGVNLIKADLTGCLKIT
ncbi:MAG: hypothetical protein BroJett011_02860 [Chloroflexota bacterium]|nr:MAG: hypothetical protein BroJett011_02860 [Chloroflexota bacterium]